MPVPLLDLERVYAPLREELEAAVLEVVRTGRFIGGPVVEAFERDFAAYVGAAHCVGVGSGTDALRLALRGLGVGAGDEVVTTSMTFVATVEAILEVGATPVLVDADLRTGLISVEATEAAIGPRTAAIIPVHLYGQPVDLAGFRALADRHGVALIEDAAQAHGASRDGLRAGSVGDAAAFSFYPGKNLGAFGEGGAVTTNDPVLAERIARLRDHGRQGKYEHVDVGTNARLDAIQAAALAVKLPYLEGDNARRREHAAAYDEAFCGIPHIEVEPGVISAYHHYVLLPEDRASVAAHLAAKGVDSGVHYPIPVHEQPGLRAHCRCACALPGAETLASRVLSIPVFPQLADHERELVIDAVRTAPVAVRTAA